MQGCKARAQEDVPVLEVLLGGGAPLRQSSGHHLGAGAVVPHFNQHLLAAIITFHDDCYHYCMLLMPNNDNNKFTGMLANVRYLVGMC